MNARATFYDIGGGGVACGHHQVAGTVPAAVFGTTALYEAGFNASAACGTCYEFPTSTGAITVMVTDLCPVLGNEQWCGGDMPHFDLTQPVFAAMADTTLGIVHVSPRLVDCPVEGSISVFMAPGSNDYWYGIYVYGHRVGLANVEVLPPAPATYQPTQRQNYNAWVYQPAGATPSVRLRFTSVLGEVVTSTVNLLPGATGLVSTGVQFQQGHGATSGTCSLPSNWP
jgi:expansin (peptidoglycan-binding protein)